MKSNRPTTHRSSRRDFLKQSTAIATAGAWAGYFTSAAPLLAADSPNERMRLGCIGVGGQGMHDAKDFAKYVDILAVCDVDSNRAGLAKDDKQVGQGKADAYGDYRKILDRKDIDIVSVVTTDHWHTKIAIEALQAGKHVFCEKPLTLTIAENQLIRAACQKYSDRVFFIGTQQRSTENLFLRAVNLVQKGLLGDIQKVTCSIGASNKGGPFAKTAPPPELNWDMWLGQAPKVDYIKERTHGNFRWWYEYSGGKFTDWGAHHVDIASWALGLDKQGQGPIEIDGVDGVYQMPFKDGYPTQDDSYNTAVDFSVKCKFASGLLMDVTSRGDNGIIFEGTKGRFFVNRSKITGVPIEEQWDKDKWGPEDLVRLYKGKPFEPHKKNFLTCIREGGLPVSDVYSHTAIMNTCHLAGIASRLARTIKWDPAAEKIVDDSQAAGFLAREQRAGYELPKV
jgi:predicted dehydrogenase